MSSLVFCLTYLHESLAENSPSENKDDTRIARELIDTTSNLNTIGESTKLFFLFNVVVGGAPVPGKVWLLSCPPETEIKYYHYYQSCTRQGEDKERSEKAREKDFWEIED